jgi:predicted GNAT family N-acyltransferase
MEIVLSFSDRTIDHHFRSLLSEADSDGLVDAPEGSTRDLIDCIHHRTEAEQITSQPGVLLISDRLARNLRPTPVVGELTEAFRTKPVALLAVSEDGRRVPDVDRTLAQDCTARELESALGALQSRLDYLTRPEPAEAPPPCVVRPVRKQTELHAYFRLRHDVYSAMGYLSDVVEQAKSRLDIDACDWRSHHIGAFASEGPLRGRLMGTVRLIPYEAVETEVSEWVMDLAQRDPALRKRVQDEFQLRLPIFQSSSSFNEYLDQETRQVARHAELSRLIVSPEARGGGVSRQLMQAALDQAAASGIDRVFLECLETHVTMYERFGFRRMPLALERVIDIGRTMVPMILEMEKGEER